MHQVNAFTAMRHGISPTEYYKSFLQKNWTELTNYLELNEKLIGLELMQKSGKKGLSYEIESLKKQLDENWFSSLIKDGQFSTIMEDLNTNESLSKRSHFDDLIKQKVDKSSKFVQKCKRYMGHTIHRKRYTITSCCRKVNNLQWYY